MGTTSELTALLGPNICLSGGAEGADLQWGMVAGSAGHTVIHWSFAGHRTQAPPQEVVVLSQTMLSDADNACHQANATLQRRFPPAAMHTANLLRRNWYQVRDAQACYGVTSLTSGSDRVAGAAIDGGTAWAIQMFIDRFGGGACPVFIYCQRRERWYRWDGCGWHATDDPPTPSGVYAGIGTRKLSLGGKQAIRTILKLVS